MRNCRNITKTNLNIENPTTRQRSRRAIPFAFLFVLFAGGFFINLPLRTASADNALYSIKELPNVTTPAWRESYQAYGREINVDVDIVIPDVEQAPVILVQNGPAIPEPLNSGLAKEYKDKDRKDKVYTYKFQSDDYLTRVKYHFPPEGGKTKKDTLDPIKMKQEENDLPRYDENLSYAENNPLTVREAIDVAKKHISELQPEVEAKIDAVSTVGGTYWRKSGKPIQPVGFYLLDMRQLLRGIPFMAETNETFSVEFDWEKRNRNPDLRGTVFAEVFDEESWVYVGYLYQETGVVCEDIPLLPFDAVKDQVEELILKGYIRWIYSITLGYVQYETENPEEQVLVPSWVIWCEYHKDGPSSEQKYGINDSPRMFDGNNPYYRPLIINAQTGVMIDTESEAEDRYACPDLSAWITE